MRCFPFLIFLFKVYKQFTLSLFYSRWIWHRGRLETRWTSCAVYKHQNNSWIEGVNEREKAVLFVWICKEEKASLGHGSIAVVFEGTRCKQTGKALALHRRNDYQPAQPLLCFFIRLHMYIGLPSVSVRPAYREPKGFSSTRILDHDCPLIQLLTIVTDVLSSETTLQGPWVGQPVLSSSIQKVLHKRVRAWLEDTHDQSSITLLPTLTDWAPPNGCFHSSERSFIAVSCSEGSLGKTIKWQRHCRPTCVEAF